MFVVVSGPVGSGKTCLVQRLCFDAVLGSDPTVACCSYQPSFLEPFGATLWDTPGDERFSWTFDRILQRAKLVLYCLEPGDPGERDYARVTPDAEVWKVQTKVDTRAGPAEPKGLNSHARTFQEANRSSKVFETSAKTGEGIAELREALAEFFRAQTSPAPAAGKLTPAKPKRSRC